jgi:hypothetical protein
MLPMISLWRYGLSKIFVLAACSCPQNFHRYQRGGANSGSAEYRPFRHVPAVLHTTAGQGYPEPSPYDAYIFDRTMRFVGDKVAAILAETPEIAAKPLPD